VPSSSLGALLALALVVPGVLAVAERPATVETVPAGASLVGGVPHLDPDGVTVVEAALEVEAAPATGSQEPAEEAPPPTEAPVDPLAETVVAEPERTDDGRAETPPIDVTGVETFGVTWPDGAAGEGLDSHVRLLAEGEWTDWYELSSDASPDAGTPDTLNARGGTDSVWVGEADAVQLSFAADPAGGPDDLRLALVTPVDGSAPSTGAGGSRPGTRPTFRTAAPSALVPTAVDPPAFGVITRAQWGARPQVCQPDVASGLVSAVVHHTAGSNGYSTVEDAMRQIRGDQAYHIDGRGWCDIGYNFVVDKWGNIYEGRADSMTQPVIGVHTGGFNTGSVGVSMLGTFSTVNPPAATLESVARVIGYRLGSYGVNPAGMMTYTTPGGENSSVPAGSTVSLPVVFAHRDVAYTSCPGQLGYNNLGWIRVRAQRVAFSGPLVRALYHDMLQRGVDPTGYATWRGQLLAGAPASVVSDQISRSQEYVQRRITEAYGEILGRGPDPSGMDTWTREIMSGRLRVEHLRGTLIASDEYFLRSGGTLESYIAALYRDILRRGAAPDEIAWWVGHVSRAGRQAAPDGVWRSLESAQLRVHELYGRFLDRAADPTGLGTWAPYWQQYGEDQLRNELVASDEYLARSVLVAP